MHSTYPVKQLSISISKPFKLVNDFLAVPENFQKWASGLGQGFKKVNDEWVVEGPEGTVKVQFTPKNIFGVADHFVEINPDLTVYIPLRVIANNQGSEVCLTLFQLPFMTAEKFAEDAQWVEKDLHKLKALLEA